MLSVFTSPGRYTQGKDATRALGRELTALGIQGPVLIVAGRTVRALLEPVWRESLAESNYSYHIHPFGGECSLAGVGRVKTAAQEEGSRVIVGAGGGKVLDAARAAAADLDLPVVNCPTVASSDAPC